MFLLIKSFLAFYDDEDDIIIVEEKDALDVPDQIEFVAEEVVIEETVGDDDYTEIICVSPKYINEISSMNGRTKQYDMETSLVNESHDDIKNEVLQAASMSTVGENTQTEPIYLSDSLSCFDSDSDTHHSEIPYLAEKLELKNMELDLSQHADEHDEAQPLNESADDVIIVSNCTDTIEIDRSDTDDERFSGTVSFDMCVESDSQPSIDSNDQENNKNRIQSGCDSSHLCDADDDSSEAERRYVRSRRDNVARKNYSFRRNYAKRKIKNDIDTQNSDETNIKNAININEGKEKIKTIECSKPEKCSSDQTLKINEMIAPSMTLEYNTTDGTDEEASLNSMKEKTVTPYDQKYTSSSNTISKIVPVKDRDKSELDCQTENMKSSYHEDQECPQPESIQIPRRRGRPRKKAVFVKNMKSNDGPAMNPNDKPNGITQSPSLPNESPFDEPNVQTNEQNAKYDILQESNSTILSTNELIEEVYTISKREGTVINEISRDNIYTKIELTQSVIQSGIEKKVLNEEHVRNAVVENLDLQLASSKYIIWKHYFNNIKIYFNVVFSFGHSE